MVRENRIDFTEFVKRKIIPESDFFVIKQSHHLLLGKRSKKQSECDIIIAISCMEKYFKIMVAHEGIG